MTLFRHNLHISAMLIFVIGALPAWGQFSGPGSGGEIYYTGGDVGVGTATPQSRLQVNGIGLGTTAGATSPLLTLFNGNGNGSFFNIFQVRNANGNSWNSATTRIQQTIDVTNMGYIDFNPLNGPQGLAFGSSGSEYLRINFGGNVGIGTPTPSSGLHVIQTTGGASSNWYDPANYAATIHQDLNSAQRYGLLVSDRWRSTENFVFAVDGRFTNGYGTIAEDTHNPLLIVRGDGNVGVGTAAPQHKLAVNGTIGAKEIIVTNSGWADYVFNSGYRLQPLSEVAAYIKDNHHLPDIPSETEVLDNGVSIGEMQAKLLAKIEELTLHMIRADEENQELKKRIARLEAK